MDSSKKHGKTAEIAWIEHGTSMENVKKVTPRYFFKNPIGTAYLTTFCKSGTGFPYALSLKLLNLNKNDTKELYKMVKKQHYVPQFYLRNFSEKSNSMVTAYLKNQKKYIYVNVKRICYENNFYDFKDNKWLEERLLLIKEHYNLDLNIEEKLQKNPQYLETVFLNTLERETAITVKNVLKSSNGLTLQNIEVRTKLILLLLNLYQRSSFKREKYTYLNEQRTEAYSKFTEDIKNDLLGKYITKPDELQLKEMMNPYSHIGVLTNYISNKYEWTLATVEGNKTLLTSDNPAGNFFMKEICFPISINKAILIRPKDHNQRRIYKEKKNKKFVVNLSDKSIFSSNLFQNSTSKLLIGNKLAMKEFIDLYESLNRNNKNSLK